MQAEANVLLAPEEAVSRMSLEVVPDLLDRIEFGCVGGEAFEVEPGESVAHRVDRRSLVNLSAIPEEDDLPTQMLEQHTQELGHVHGLEVVLSKLDVQAQAGTPGRDRERRDGRDPVVLVVVANDRGAPSRVPGPTARGNKGSSPESDQSFVMMWDGP